MRRDNLGGTKYPINNFDDDDEVNLSNPCYQTNLSNPC